MSYTPGQYLPPSFFKPKSLIIKRRKHYKTPSNELTNAILFFLSSKGAVAWRNNNMGIFMPSKGIYRLAPNRGVSDILGCFKGLFLAVEVKSGYDKLSPFQESFLSDIQNHGGLAFIARDLNVFMEEWDLKTKTI